MFCVYTLRQHPLYTLASLVAYTLLQPLRIPKGARPLSSLKRNPVYFTPPPSLLVQTPPNLACTLYFRYLSVLGYL
jgi:hypothetical protein